VKSPSDRRLQYQLKLLCKGGLERFTPSEFSKTMALFRNRADVKYCKLKS
jgi:hypothetical protein